MIPFHLYGFRVFPLGASLGSARRAYAQVRPKRLCLKRSAFPRCHFNCVARQRGRGLVLEEANRKAAWTLIGSAVVAKHTPTHQCLSKRPERGIKVQTSHSGNYFDGHERNKTMTTYLDLQKNLNMEYPKYMTTTTKMLIWTV